MVITPIYLVKNQPGRGSVPLQVVQLNGDGGLDSRFRGNDGLSAVIPPKLERYPRQGLSGRFAIPYSTLKPARDGGVATIALHRPENGNRVNAAMAAELRELTSELSADDTLRVVILTGSGPVFSTGRETPADAAGIERLQAAGAIASLPMPVLVALNGDVTDHGLELALVGDIRLAARGAGFGFSLSSVGNFPFDGATQRLPRLVGPGWARDMLLTGRRVSADEALSIGLVNRVSAPDEDPLQLAHKLAEGIMEGSPLGARYAKEAVTLGADLTLGQALGLETDLNVILQSTADRAEGIASFLQRRNPEFTGE